MRVAKVLVLAAFAAYTCRGQTVSCEGDELSLDGECWQQVLKVGGRAVAPQIVWPKEVGRNPNGASIWTCPGEYVPYLIRRMETCIPKELDPAQRHSTQITPPVPVVVEQAKLAEPVKQPELPQNQPQPVSVQLQPVSDGKVPVKEPLSQTVEENVTHKESPVLGQIATSRVSFACADEFGVHLCVPGWVSKWVKKNSEKFLDLSFSQAPIPNGRNYLVVLSSSESVYSGLDAVVTHSTSTNMVPVTGTGTVVDNGYAWTFTFNGMATVTTNTTTDENVPYSIQTKTSFVRVYDGHGALISEHRRRVSTRQGGDSANSIGYNSVAIVAGILRRNGVLLNETMKDIEKTLR